MAVPVTAGGLASAAEVFRRGLAHAPGDLPHGLAPPLRFLEPWWRRPETWLPWVLGLVLALLLAGLAAYLWRRWRRSRRSAPAPPPQASPRPDPSGWWGEVYRLWEEYRTTDPRRGLAELSRWLRDHLAGPLPAVDPHPGLTAEEVAERADSVADDDAARLLRLVSLHQFGRREPDTADFDDICTLAMDLLKTRNPGGAAPPLSPATFRTPGARRER